MSKCKSIYHKSISQEYKTNKWCSCCERDICFTCYPLEKWIWCSNCQMDMCLDCYKCQFEHKDKDCEKYTSIIINDRDYNPSYNHNYIFYSLFLGEQFIQDLIFSLPCNQELIYLLYSISNYNYRDNPFSWNIKERYSSKFINYYKMTRLYELDNVEISFIQTNKFINKNLYKEIIRRYKLTNNYKDNCIYVNIILYGTNKNGKFCFDYSDHILDHILLLQSDKENVLFSDLLNKYKNEFLIKDVYVKSLFKSNDISNIILQYNNLYKNHYTLSFNPLKPKLYKNNKQLVKYKFINKEKINLDKLVGTDIIYSENIEKYKYFEPIDMIIN